MLDTQLYPTPALTSGQQARRAALVHWLFVGALLGLTALIGLAMLRGQPAPAHLLLLFLGLVFAAILLEPRAGIYASVFFSLLGDAYLLPWYPFFKNFSAVESVLYLHDALVFSPLSACLLLTLVSAFVRLGLRRRLAIRRQPLFWPAMFFAATIVAGVAYGLATGGDARVALWEAVPILYMPLMLVLVSNLLTTRADVDRLMWVAMAAIGFEGLIGTYRYLFILNGSLSQVVFFTEHTASIHIDVLFVFALAVWVYRGSLLKRLALPIMAMPVLITYLASQRRAAFVALVVALLLLAFVLYQRRRLLFWLATPAALLVTLVYLAVYWNGNGALAMPARAIKAVVAPNQADARDYYSTQYRTLENVNILHNLRQAPLTGVGFGQKYQVIVPMPDISFFEWWQYITHNSVLWIWIKAGVAGFVALLLLVGLAIQNGVAALQRLPGDDLSAIVLTAVLFVMMHFTFAYVDISWEPQSMMLLGAMLGIIGAAEHLTTDSDHGAESRPAGAGEAARAA